MQRQANRRPFVYHLLSLDLSREGRGTGLLMVGGERGKKGRGRVNCIVLSSLRTPGPRPGPAMGLLSPGLNTDN